MPITLGSRPEHGFDQPLGLLSDCHRRIERFLGILETIVERAAGRALKEEERRAVETALEYFQSAAPRHTADEEESLFPLLWASEKPEVQSVIQTLKMLEYEHASAKAAHAEADFWYRRWLAQGPLAPPQMRKLTRVLQTLRDMYGRHIDIEDHEVFPMAGRLLSREQLGLLGRQMAERRGVRHAIG